MEGTVCGNNARAHIDRASPDMGRAYAHMCTLMHTRLVAYGRKWEVWTRKRSHTSLPSIIPPHIRDDLKFIKFEMSGEHYVHPKFLTEARLNLKPNENEKRA